MKPKNLTEFDLLTMNKNGGVGDRVSLTLWSLDHGDTF